MFMCERVHKAVHTTSLRYYDNYLRCGVSSGVVEHITSHGFFIKAAFGYVERISL